MDHLHYAMAQNDLQSGPLIPSHLSIRAALFARSLASGKEACVYIIYLLIASILWNFFTKQSLHFRPWKIFRQGAIMRQGTICRLCPDEILLPGTVCFQSKCFVQT